MLLLCVTNFMQQLGNCIILTYTTNNIYNEFLNNLNGKVITDVTEAYNQYVQYGQAYGGIPPYQVSEYQNNFNVAFSATDIADSM